MNSSKRTNRGESSISPRLGRPPVRSRRANVQAGPDVQANGQACSNGLPDGLAMAGQRAQPDVDPFGLASLRLSQDFASASESRNSSRHPDQKPRKSGLSGLIPTRTIAPNGRLGAERGSGNFLVARLSGGNWRRDDILSPVLVTAINRQAVLFLWPIRLPGPTARLTIGADRRWTRPMRQEAVGPRHGQHESWSLYVAVASGQVAEPEWPSITFQEIIRIAFRDKMISEWNHPVLRRLRGEV